MPLPKSTRLFWQSALLERSYKKDIRFARLGRDYQRAENLEREHAYEIEMIQEEEDQLYTRRLVRQAKRLRVPTPRSHGEDGKPTGAWEQGRNFGLWYLSDKGIVKLREEIRKEIRWRHERRAQWVGWLSAITGVFGALTGLIAVLLYG